MEIFITEIKIQILAQVQNRHIIRSSYTFWWLLTSKYDRAHMHTKHAAQTQLIHIDEEQENIWALIWKLTQAFATSIHISISILSCKQTQSPLRVLSATVRVKKSILTYSWSIIDPMEPDTLFTPIFIVHTPSNQSFSS